MEIKELKKLAKEAQIQTELYVGEISKYIKIDPGGWKAKATAENRMIEKKRYEKEVALWKEKCKKIKEEQKFWSEKKKLPEKPFELYFDMRPYDYILSRSYLSGSKGSEDEVEGISTWYEPLSQEALEELIYAQKTHQFKRFEIWKIESVKDSPIVMVGFSSWLDEWSYSSHWEDGALKFMYKICEWSPNIEGIVI